MHVGMRHPTFETPRCELGSNRDLLCGKGPVKVATIELDCIEVPKELCQRPYGRYAPTGGVLEVLCNP